MLVLIVTPLIADDLETRAGRLEERLMSPCCMANTVAVHESPASHRMRLEIRQMLGQGMSDREILGRYVEQHGPQILSIPDARGFNLMAYFFPLVFLVLVGAAMAVVVRRWSRKTATDADSAPVEQPPEDGAYAERLKRELEQF